MIIDRYAIRFGDLFSVHYYGVILMVGVLAAAFFSAYRAGKRKQDPNHVWDMLTWLVIAGVVGARLWHILTPPPSMVESGITFQYYITHPLDAIAIWKGGLGIPGAVIGGFIGLWLYTRQHKLSILVWCDIIAPGLALAQAIGRWGNFVNQELYGLPTDLPWGIFIEPVRRISAYAENQYFHPLFLYESLWNLVNFVILLFIEKRFAKFIQPGDTFLAYLILYPIARFFLEFLRVDASLVFEVNANQYFMAIVAALALIALVWRHRKGTATPQIKPAM